MSTVSLFLPVEITKLLFKDFNCTAIKGIDGKSKRDLKMVNWKLRSPLNCKEIQPVHSRGDQSWVFFGRNDAKTETPVLWPPHAKSWLIGKDFDAGRDWGQEEKGMTEDETAGWHHWLDGPEFEWTPGVADGPGGLACCNSWGCKELDTTERLNWTEYYTAWYFIEKL